MPTPNPENEIHLFCDTNLFLQCRPLDELDWSKWQAFEAVRVIVSHPVQSEIDGLKTKGNERQARRARKANTLFRSMLTDDGVKVIRESGPQVTLHVEPQHQHDVTPTGPLNFANKDDQIIGIACRFAKTHAEVRLLTDDTTPQYMARAVGLPADPIPDGWLLPPEPDQKDRKISELEDELKLLKQKAPAFKVTFLNYAGEEAERYNGTLDVFDPLTPQELAQLLDRLRKRHPVATKFGQLEAGRPIALPGKRFALLPDALGYVPPTDKAISQYRDVDYPAWLTRCESLLSTHHERLQLGLEALRFAFRIDNHGILPARDCQITVEATGNLLIMPPVAEADSESDSMEEVTQLPKPPSPPRGHRTSTAPIRVTAQSLPEVMRAINVSRYPSPGELTPRDPNSFYYKDIRPEKPVQSFSFECLQWRHRQGLEDFEGELRIRGDQKRTDGTLVLHLHAENLPIPIRKTIPVQISVRHHSTFESACALVENL